MPKSIKDGHCKKFKRPKSPDQLCDYFVPKRKRRYKVICKNCSFFESYQEEKAKTV